MNKAAVGFGIAIAASASILAGCSGGAQGGDGRNGMAMGGSTRNASATDHNAADVTFVQQMIAHHQQGRQMAKLAASHAADPRVKALASKMDQTQNAQITAMLDWLGQWGVNTIPTMPGMTAMPDMPDMPGTSTMMSESDMRQLQEAEGTSFDELFVRMMTAHHHSGIGMARAEVSVGANPKARALAQSIMTDENAEVDEMRQLQPTP
jgi:uncharacterized protein (DUF305 family)